MVTTGTYIKANGADILRFHCNICFTKYALGVLESGRADNDYTCSEAPVHHLHTRISSDEPIDPPSAEVEIKCCLCDYHATLSCQTPPLQKDIVNAFIESLKPNNSVMSTLRILHKLLYKVVYDENGILETNYPEIDNITQTEHGM
jgi:hypothetical protein